MVDVSEITKEVGRMELPPGFRFHPTDEEIITHYLSPMVVNHGFTARAIGLEQVRTLGSSKQGKDGREGVVLLLPEGPEVSRRHEDQQSHRCRLLESHRER
ncbi:hypothetical protein OPV22_029251 [Ensete ventricosum]|uniref:NAC domain-containing protein n=1 Tax=Ensete ventricosum TaxID=4639 RepID=A0AAV8Q649_ENSVE|nr:hypothetical protein OPV22_029251 [Ensete ventricosum]